jgi:hypothetical protein
VGNARLSWEAQLAKLEVYQVEHGDCNAPKGWAEDPQLGNWVNTQRKGKRKLDCGEPSLGMTVARAAKLDKLGFTWELSAATISKQLSEGNRDEVGRDVQLDVQLAKLKAYKRKHGDCNVPNSWAEDPRLGNWVNTQRKGKRKLDCGEPSEGMTVARVAKLTTLGLAWDPAAGRC